MRTDAVDPLRGQLSVFYHSLLAYLSSSVQVGLSSNHHCHIYCLPHHMYMVATFARSPGLTEELQIWPGMLKIRLRNKMIITDQSHALINQ